MYLIYPLVNNQIIYITNGQISLNKVPSFNKCLIIKELFNIMYQKRIYSILDMLGINYLMNQDYLAFRMVSIIQLNIGREQHMDLLLLIFRMGISLEDKYRIINSKIQVYIYIYIYMLGLIFIFGLVFIFIYIYLFIYLYIYKYLYI